MEAYYIPQAHQDAMKDYESSYKASHVQLSEDDSKELSFEILSRHSSQGSFDFCDGDNDVVMTDKQCKSLRESASKLLEIRPIQRKITASEEVKRDAVNRVLGNISEQYAESESKDTDSLPESHDLFNQIVVGRSDRNISDSLPVEINQV